MSKLKTDVIDLPINGSPKWPPLFIYKKELSQTGYFDRKVKQFIRINKIALLRKFSRVT